MPARVAVRSGTTFNVFAVPRRGLLLSTQALPDHLNAEIILGTVTNLREATVWLSYTYLYTRMLRNPMAYGVHYEVKQTDPLLAGKRRELIVEAAKVMLRSRGYHRVNLTPGEC